jgi:hypothetical protein
MTAKQLVCVNCRHWESEQCNGCVFYDKFLHYEHTFLTPEQWEQRTGEKWMGAVWVGHKERGIIWAWSLDFLEEGDEHDESVLICNGPEIPGDDWEGE